MKSPMILLPILLLVICSCERSSTRSAQQKFTVAHRHLISKKEKPRVPLIVMQFHGCKAHQ